MSFVAIGLFVLACGWNVYQRFFPTSSSARRDEGHPQYFGAALTAAYVAFLAVFLHAAALQTTWYATAISTLVKLAPNSDKDSAGDAKAERSTNAASLNVGPINVERGAAFRQVLTVPASQQADSKQRNEKPAKPDPYPTAIGIALWSAVLAVTWVSILNAPFKFNWQLRELTLRKDWNEVEQAIASAYGRGLSIAVTLTTGKVYVGLAQMSAPSADEPDWITLWPLASGYRSKKGRLRLTTAYAEAYGQIDADPDIFQVVVPLEQIASIQSFSLELYVEHFLANQSNDEDATSQVPPDESGEPATSDSAANEEKKPLGKPFISSLPTPPFVKVVPDNWLKSLKWTFHCSVTAAVIALPFNLVFSLGFLFLALFALHLISDPADEHLEMLLESARDV